MTRLLVPNDEPLPEPTGEGLAGLPSVCWTIDDCAAHRCFDHTEVPVLNTACFYDAMAECGACVAAEIAAAPWWKARRVARRMLRTDPPAESDELRAAIAKAEGREP